MIRDADPWHLSLTRLANLLNEAGGGAPWVTRGLVEKWVVLGAPRAKDRTFDLAELAAWSLKARESAGTDPVSQDEARRLLGLSPRAMRALRDDGCPTEKMGRRVMMRIPEVVKWLLEREAARREADTITVAEAEARWTSMAGRIRAVVEGIADRHGGHILDEFEKGLRGDDA